MATMNRSIAINISFFFFCVIQGNNGFDLPPQSLVPYRSRQALLTSLSNNDKNFPSGGGDFFSSLSNKVLGSPSSEDENSKEKLSRTNYLDPNRPAINVRPRPTISIDTQTGTVTKKAVSAPSVSPQNGASARKSSTWDDFKDSFYDTTDAVGSLITKLQKESPTKKKNTLVKLGSETQRATPQNFALITRTAESAKPTPLSKIVENNLRVEAAKRADSNGRRAAALDKSITRPKTRNLVSSKLPKSKQPGLEENLLKPKDQSVFDIAKGSLYGAFDGVVSIATTVGSSESSRKNQSLPAGSNKKSPLAAAYAASSVEVRAFDKSTLKRAEEEEVQAYLAEASSPNLAKRLRAKWTINKIESSRLQNERSQKRAEAFVSGKDAVFSALDGVSNTAKAAMEIPSAVGAAADKAKSTATEAIATAKAIPDQISSATARTTEAIQSVPTKVGETVATVQSIPTKVSKALGDTARSTTIFVNDVKAIPSKIESKVEQTSRAVEDVSSKVRSVSTKLKDATSVVKSWTRGETSKPKPPSTLPPPPPPKPTIGERSALVARNLAGATGKAAWSLGSGAVGLAVSGAKSALSSRESTIDTANGKQQLDSFSSPSPPAIPPKTSTSELTSPSVADIDELLGEEVSEALRLAEDALARSSSVSNQGKTTSADGKARQRLESAVDELKNAAIDAQRGAMAPASSQKSSDIKAALERAKAAALLASKEAAELEEMLRGKASR